MVLNFVAVGGSNLLLQHLDFFRNKLDNLAAGNIHHVIMVAALIQLVVSLTAFKVMLDHQPGSLKLAEHPVNRSQTNVFAFLHQRAVDVVGGHVLLGLAFQHVEDALSRMRDLKAGLLEISGFHLNIVSLRLAPDLNSKPIQLTLLK